MTPRPPRCLPPRSLPLALVPLALLPLALLALAGLPRAAVAQPADAESTLEAGEVEAGEVEAGEVEAAQLEMAGADEQLEADELEEGELEAGELPETVHWARPMTVLAIGVAVVLGAIIVLKINAFIALITAAMVVSLLSPGEFSESIARVATAFGNTAAGIAIVIAMAAVIGKCMLDSGAADRIVRAFVRLTGERHAPVALTSSGYVLAIPVFFDTVFYLLVPLARSLHRRTGREYLKYILAIAAGGAITHTLVPPTPGPLLMAQTLGVDFGIMILIGMLVAIPAAVVGIVFADIANRLMQTPMRPLASGPEPEPLRDDQLPSLLVAALPLLLPVLLISGNSIFAIVYPALVEMNAEMQHGLLEMLLPPLRVLLDILQVVGNPNFALLLSAAIAMGTLARQRKLSRIEMAHVVETSLMSGGVIILITAAGGAFGAMLREAQIGDAIESLFGQYLEGAGTSMAYLLMGFLIAMMLKFAQGSSTVAMIVGSGMMAAIIGTDTSLGFHPVYLATAIGGGSLVGSWMNDSGFWIFAKMGGLTEVETLKSWTIMLVALGLTSFGVSVLLALLLPMV